MKDNLMDPEIRMAETLASRFYGKYRGLVTDNQDPAQAGRLRVKVPLVLGDVESWALPCVPYAGSGVGHYTIPAADTLVWVEFEGGNPSMPIWTGCFWGDGELPDESNPDIKILKTASCTIRIDDAAGEILLEVDGGGKITINSEIIIEAGDATVTLGSGTVVTEAGGGKVEVGNAAVKCNDGALEVM
jgi:uncharacterized protein involved in type VI secretion and phage assembly